jgi:hypothetical protein
MCVLQLQTAEVASESRTDLRGMGHGCLPRNIPGLEKTRVGAQQSPTHIQFESDQRCENRVSNSCHAQGAHIY